MEETNWIALTTAVLMSFAGLAHADCAADVAAKKLAGAVETSFLMKKVRSDGCK